MIDIYPQYQRRKIKSRFFDHVKTMTGLRLVPFSCARSALVCGLRALDLKRTDEIFVPPFLSHCVLSAVGKVVFPTMTPSVRTKAVLVVHQFGFLQDTTMIEKTAHAKGWKIVNDCCHTVFSCLSNRYLLEWGDFSVISLSKLYPCILGGGLFTDQKTIEKKIQMDIQGAFPKDQQKADEIFRFLRKIPRMQARSSDFRWGIDAVFGCLPEVKHFPTQAYYSLPASVEEIQGDIHHRKAIWQIISSIFPKRVPNTWGRDLIPFAVPLMGDEKLFPSIASWALRKYQAVLPTLHFDFNCNMLNPAYRKALLIGCHAGWRQDMVEDICRFIQKKLK